VRLHDVVVSLVVSSIALRVVVGLVVVVVLLITGAGPPV
jgi:hypothetical protein